MADDFNSFNNIFSDEPEKNARVVGKFRPKPKAQPQKKVSAKSSVASSKAVKTIQSTQHESSECIQSAKPLEQSSSVLPDDNTKQTSCTIDSAPIEFSQHIKNAEQLEHGSDAVRNDISDLHVKSVEENADVLSGSEARTDFLRHTNTGVAPNSLNTENIGGRLGAQVVSSIDDSTNTCNVDDVPEYSGLAAEGDALAADEPGQRTGKFQPKPNLQMQNNTHEESDSTSYSLGLQAGPLPPDSAENNLIPTFQNDNAFDLSSPGFTHTFPTESTSELHLNEESVNLMEVHQLNSGANAEGLPEIPAKLASRRAKTAKSKSNAASDPHSQQQKASTLSHENGASKLLRPRKKDTNIYGLVDEDGDETITSGEFSKERPSSSATDEGNINNEQPRAESESQKKNLKRKSKKTENDKEKPPRKGKKAKEASEQETRAKPKKFSHSTRRRRVDQNLLNIPEEEFDPSEVPLRDLILLAEHREKQMKSGQITAGAPATQQSIGYSDYNNDPAGQYSNDPAGQYNEDGEENPIAEDTSEYFNYQSRMEKTPRARWSKQDTELFYEAVQQFGTDFSMIAQLFPGRMREQIRNKYKKEERQHPLRLREALTNRSKDMSYFREVIDNLNKIRAEQEEQEEREDMEDLINTEKPDEEVSNADDGEGKHEYEHVEEEENGDIANGFSEFQSTEKMEEKAEEEEEADEEEDDEMFLLSQYKSER